ncbi:hypothetical protein [Brotaphodocola sp.]|uniref:hypothetical protein n=1 Tax=Brotaphodocola sp. TaxID=3073577 RepID=UPI003D7D4E26
MISMIPFGLLAGFAEFDGETAKSVEKKEIRITGIEEEAFFFRLAEWDDTARNRLRAFRICFYEMEKKSYREIRITDFSIAEVIKKEFWTEISVNVQQGENGGHLEKQSEFSSAVQKLISQYDRYIRLKLECSDAEVSEALIGYPATLDGIRAGDLMEQKRQWFDAEKDEGNAPKNVGKFEDFDFPEIALELDQPVLYENYLSVPAQTFARWYWEKNGLNNHPLAACRPSRLYIGNSFCPLLFPKEEILMRLLEKAGQENLSVTLVFSYLREEWMEKTEKLLQNVDAWWEKQKAQKVQKDQNTQNMQIEIVINDWAMADLVSQKTRYLTPSLGILLNKRRKDPRGRYLETWRGKSGEQGYGKQNLGRQENNLYAAFYRNFLKKEFGIERYEWESVDGLIKSCFPGEKNSLHLPFYQTNTSQYCTLYAGCVHGERGYQTLVRACPKFCNHFVYLYPKHLNMVGRGNSLFGFDIRILGELRDFSVQERAAKEAEAEKTVEEKCQQSEWREEELAEKRREEACRRESKCSRMRYWRKLGIDRLVINLMEVGDEKIQ